MLIIRNVTDQTAARSGTTAWPDWTLQRNPFANSQSTLHPVLILHICSWRRIPEASVISTHACDPERVRPPGVIKSVSENWQDA